MKRLLLLSFFLTTLAIAGQGQYRFLHYQFNDRVVITISNAPCTDKSLVKEYPYAVVATRIDNQFLKGCFKDSNKDDIEIQWLQGDKTILPANVFLVNPDGTKQEPMIY